MAPVWNAARILLDACSNTMSEHVLYVRVVAPGGDAGARARTLETLRWLDDNSSSLREMGVAMRVERVGSAALADPKIVAALAAAGVTSLPALRTPTGVYLGLAAIATLYGNNARALHAARATQAGPASRRTGAGGAPRPSVDNAEDALENWRTAEISGKGGSGDNNDSDSDGDGDASKKMAAAVNAQMMQRSKMTPAGRGGRPPNSRRGQGDGNSGGGHGGGGGQLDVEPARFAYGQPAQPSQRPAQRQAEEDSPSVAASDAWAHLKQAPPGDDGDEPVDPRDDMMVQALLDNLE
jgi:hypothetical protein